MLLIISFIAVSKHFRIFFSTLFTVVPEPLRVVFFVLLSASRWYLSVQARSQVLHAYPRGASPDFQGKTDPEGAWQGPQELPHGFHALSDDAFCVLHDFQVRPVPDEELATKGG